MRAKGESENHINNVSVDLFDFDFVHKYSSNLFAFENYRI
jgi:hypothetical protein